MQVPVDVFNLVSALLFDKAPSQAGTRVLAFDGTAVDIETAKLALVGDCFVQLGLAVGAIFFTDLANIRVGERVPIQEKAKKWCGIALDNC